MSDNFSVLLIDDDEHIQELFKMVFDHHGHTLRVASDLSGAVSTLNEFQPDVIVLDIFLQHTDGYKVLNTLRTQFPNLNSPFVATTAYYTSDTESDVMKHGFDGYLLKPISPQTLVPYLEKIGGH